MTNLDTILKRLVADIDDAMEMQGTGWKPNSYAERDVSKSMFKAKRAIKALIAEETRLIQVLYASEMSNLDQEIMSLKAEIKRLQTLTKEDSSEKELDSN